MEWKLIKQNTEKTELHLIRQKQLMMQFICGKQPVKKREVLTQMM